ncbi:MAG TPA: phosphate butyryltransferase [Eubacteriaceae bacterium]|nr:phosphate butyryltransferase [Eubacteriaceae bacterium]
MIQSFEQLYDELKGYEPKNVVVMNAAEEDVLQSLKAASDQKLIRPFVTGREEEIVRLAKKLKIDLNDFVLYNTESDEEAVDRAMQLMKEGVGEVLMKGNVATSMMLKGVLKREYGLRTERLLSHVSLFEVKNFPRLLWITDIAMNIDPDAKAKKEILENCAEIARICGNDNPHGAAICAVEKANEKMPDTVDAGKLVEWYNEGEITACTVSGPFALDNALSEKSAKTKGIADPYAGNIDILLMPDIEAGNILNKALNYLADSRSAGLVTGAKVPIVLTSRSDSADAKQNSIALDVYVSVHKEK